MFDGEKFTAENGNLDRTWIIFFESLKGSSSTGGGAVGPYIRTLLLKDTTAGNDIADHVPIWVKGKAARVIAILRKTISSDLIVRINLDGVALITVTIPGATAIDTPIIATEFMTTQLADLQVLTWDVTASDGSKDANGIASLTLQFS